MSAAVGRDQPEDLTVSLRYLKRCEIYKVLRPYTLACKVDDEFPTNNLVFQYGPPQKIFDIRGLAPGHLSVERNGISMVKHEFRAGAEDEESINKPGGYLDELRQLVKDQLGNQGIVVEDAKVINWVHRTAREEGMFKNATLSGKTFNGFAPDTYVHNDCNFYGGDKRIRAVLGDDAESILATKRVRIMNCWKPIVNTVEDCNLTICDASTVDHDKCVHGDFIVTPDYVSQTNYADYSEQQVWYYISHQRTDELLFFMQHDTDEQSNARYCPHGAFWKDDPSKCSTPRESIEVRVLLITPK
ncbi:hypothetical protein DHEL01_v208882 [Diaporthe helianthi]|uniref:CmcJ-like methyltransferase n=1 Tax=Diaporthe helianthi TaxID=158607 RepID=A0A2P5HR54_DIAHE|nr:hypothetical protein DHEL01_v208882 [Diaporthe helianthi]